MWRALWKLALTRFELRLDLFQILSAGAVVALAQGQPGVTPRLKTMRQIEIFVI